LQEEQEPNDHPNAYKKRQATFNHAWILVVALSLSRLRIRTANQHSLHAEASKMFARSVPPRTSPTGPSLIDNGLVSYEVRQSPLRRFIKMRSSKSKVSSSILLRQSRNMSRMNEGSASPRQTFAALFPLKATLDRTIHFQDHFRTARRVKRALET
jgi:hypothetical protein